MASVTAAVPAAGPQLWWQSCLSRQPLRWTDGKAIYVDVKQDIVPDTQTGVSASRWTNMRRHHHDWLMREFGILPDRSRLIDVGCGQSQFRDLIGRFDVCGIDHFPYPGADVVADFAEALPLADGCADAAMLSNVLEHLYEPRVLLAECLRVLRPGAPLFVVVPFMIKLHQTPHDFHRYTEFALAAMARDCGFAGVRIERLGNIFDVYDIDRWIRANLIRSSTTGWRRLAARALIKLQNETERTLMRVIPSELRGATDTVGFPQSYGMFARRPAVTSARGL